MKKPFADPEGIIRYVQMQPHFEMKEYAVTVLHSGGSMYMNIQTVNRF